MHPPLAQLVQVGIGGDEKPAKPEEEVKNFDAEFVKVDQGTLFELILAANYLNIKYASPNYPSMLVSAECRLKIDRYAGLRLTP